MSEDREHDANSSMKSSISILTPSSRQSIIVLSRFTDENIKSQEAESHVPGHVALNGRLRKCTQTQVPLQPKLVLLTSILPKYLIPAPKEPLGPSRGGGSNLSKLNPRNILTPLFPTKPCELSYDSPEILLGLQVSYRLVQGLVN